MKIWHNNRCSKSRCAVDLLVEKKVNFEEFKYLESTLEPKDIRDLLKMLGIKAEDLIRKGEPIFKEKYKGKSLSENEWIEAMIENPKLIERPILVNNGKAIIGRPPENVLQII